MTLTAHLRTRPAATVLLALAVAFALLGLSTLATHGWTEIHADQ